VPHSHYTASFGLQWQEFRKTQLDSYTRTTISRDRLTRILGGNMAVVRGKKVLEVGCGAGRFTEVLLEAGAWVLAVDSSDAVKANRLNCGGHANYFVCQGDVTKMPLAGGRFDIVLCVGMIQHTPDPEATIGGLCSQLRPGGMLAIDHYTRGRSLRASRRVLRLLLTRMPPKAALWVCRGICGLLWPLHDVLWRGRSHWRVNRLRQAFVRLSPVVDYHETYPQLSPELLREWALLDTHDTLTDHYKHFRNTEEIELCLRKCGMQDVVTTYAGNGVEARARRPVGT